LFEGKSEDVRDGQLTGGKKRFQRWKKRHDNSRSKGSKVDKPKGGSLVGMIVPETTRVSRLKGSSKEIRSGV